MKITAIGQPHQYMRSFSVMVQKRKKTEDGTVVKVDESESSETIVDGILAEADIRTINIWNQNQNPISHTIVSYHPAVNVHKNDVLVTDDRRFLVKGMEDPAGTGQFAIYYVLERNDA